ncbi:superoxide dismutase, Fe-Mn family [Natribacillus halophilus]|uniref:superoxide dismutase n=1 Tax=Natribacillus halophilus TaxID=549003 RepID=A0A1G8JG29_9BACI|nr:superoxide dismutase, Fe-Mn family [Natribacillus halophilus]
METYLDAEHRSSEANMKDKLEKVRTELDATTSDPDQLIQSVEALAAELEKNERSSTKAAKKEAHPVEPGQHELPPLPYAYDALEPYIAAEIMYLHHDVHHRAYVEGLNEAEEQMQKARRDNKYDLITHWEREAAFHGAGHYLHTIFWEIMDPKGGGKPKGDLLAMLERDFGSYQRFRAHFTAAAEELDTPGWVILVWSPRAQRLEILNAELHHYLSQWDVIPLLVLDIWEHAYYLQYKTDKEAYVENWWEVVNWPAVQHRLEVAQKVKWTPY